METLEKVSLDSPVKEIIEKHARVALMKVRKPSIYDYEDLVSEGALVFCFTRRRYALGRSATFTTFFTGCLRNHFADLVAKTYKRGEVATINTGLFETLASSFPNPRRAAHIGIAVSKLQEIEREYLSLVLDPPQFITELFVEYPRYKNLIIETHLGISCGERRRIERKLIDILSS